MINWQNRAILQSSSNPLGECRISMYLGNHEIEDIVRWRMGRAYDAPIVDWRSEAVQFVDQGFRYRNATGFTECNGKIEYDFPWDFSFPDLAKTRLTQTLEMIQFTPPDVQSGFSGFFITEDAVFPSMMTLLDKFSGQLSAQFAFNRPKNAIGRDEQTIIWPLQYEKNTIAQDAKDIPQWSKKTNDILWRGQTTGFSYDYTTDLDFNYFPNGVRRPGLMAWLNGLNEGRFDDFEEWFESYQRLLAFSICQRLGLDVSIVNAVWTNDQKNMDYLKARLGAKAVSDRIKPKEYRQKINQNKVVLSIPGNDIPSSLASDLSSGSVTLLVDSYFECCWYYGLQEGVHYVAVKADLSNLEEKINWCRDNDAEAKDIAQTARDHAIKHFNRDTQTRALARTIERYKENLVAL